MQILQFKKGENWSNQKLGGGKKKGDIKKSQTRIGRENQYL